MPPMLSLVPQKRRSAIRDVRRMQMCALLAAFGALFALAAWVAPDFTPSPWALVIVALGAYRLARIAAFEEVFEPVRRLVGHGAIGDLIECPLCGGVWAAALLTYGVALTPHVGMLAAFLFAAAGVQEFLNHVVSLVHVRQETGVLVRNQLEEG